MQRHCKWNCNCMWVNQNDNCDDKYETKCSNVANEREGYNDNCMCGFDEEENLFPTNPMFGQSYVPWQRMKKTFVPEVGLRMGTIFPELVNPYCPGQGMEEIKYIEQTNTIGKGCNR